MRDRIETCRHGDGVSRVTPSAETYLIVVAEAFVLRMGQECWQRLGL